MLMGISKASVKNPCRSFVLTLNTLIVSQIISPRHFLRSGIFFSPFKRKAHSKKSLKSNIKSFGYINDGFVVIATGFYKEGILEVSNFELPEIETISESRKIYTDNDIWHYEVH